MKWVEAAEKALAGDMRALWLQYDLATAPPVEWVLSEAVPPSSPNTGS